MNRILYSTRMELHKEWKALTKDLATYNCQAKWKWHSTQHFQNFYCPPFLNEVHIDSSIDEKNYIIPTQQSFCQLSGKMSLNYESKGEDSVCSLWRFSLISSYDLISSEIDIAPFVKAPYRTGNFSKIQRRYLLKMLAVRTRFEEGFGL